MTDPADGTRGDSPPPARKPETSVTQAPDTSAAALHIGASSVAGALVRYDPPRIERAVVAPVETAGDLSLVIAEVVAGLNRPQRLVITADFSDDPRPAEVGPADGMLDHAQKRADSSGAAFVAVAAERHGVVVAAHHVESIVRAASGAGLRVDRLEVAPTASHRATGGGRSRRIKHLKVPYDLIETSAISADQLSAIAGAALGLDRTAPGNLIGDDAAIAEPSGAGRGGAGWSVARMPAPIDFSRQLETNHREFHYTMVAFAVSFIALAVALLLL